MNFSFISDNFEYLMIGAWPNGPVGGLALTLLLCVFSAVLSALFGLLSGILLVMSGQKWQLVLVTILGFFRAIPILMLIFWIYFLLPMMLGISAPKVQTIVLALSLVGGAYLGHSVAAGLRSVGDDQWAAGLALGFNRWKVLWFLILPQALPRMAPSFINQCISLTKDTSLAYIIGTQEFLTLARQIDGRLTGAYSTEIYLFVGIVYFVLCMTLSFFAERINKHYSKERQFV